MTDIITALEEMRDSIAEGTFVHQTRGRCECGDRIH